MADYDSSLPIRTENDGDAVVKIADSTTTTQHLQVNADGSAEVNQKKLDHTTDNVAISSGGNEASVNGSGQLLVKDDNLDATTDNVAISDGTNTATVNGSNQLLVKDDDLDASTDSVQANLHDEAGNPFSLTNPLPVEMVSDAQGDEVVDYNTSASVAKSASVNHDYTVSVGKTFIGKKAFVSGSGKLKVELQVNAVTKYVGFNSTANPNIEIPLEGMLKGNATEVVRMIITNRDNAQDVYSTLSGLEV
jgi:hypothetical protein